MVGVDVGGGFVDLSGVATFFFGFFGDAGEVVGVEEVGVFGKGVGVELGLLVLEVLVILGVLREVRLLGYGGKGRE